MCHAWRHLDIKYHIIVTSLTPNVCTVLYFVACDSIHYQRALFYRHSDWGFGGMHMCIGWSRFKHANFILGLFVIHRIQCMSNTGCFKIRYIGIAKYLTVLIFALVLFFSTVGNTVITLPLYASSQLPLVTINCLQLVINILSQEWE